MTNVSLENGPVVVQERLEKCLVMPSGPPSAPPPPRHVENAELLKQMKVRALVVRPLSFFVAFRTWHRQQLDPIASRSPASCAHPGQTSVRLTRFADVRACARLALGCAACAHVTQHAHHTPSVGSCS